MSYKTKYEEDLAVCELLDDPKIRLSNYGSTPPGEEKKQCGGVEVVDGTLVIPDDNECIYLLPEGVEIRHIGDDKNIYKEECIC